MLPKFDLRQDTRSTRARPATIRVSAGRISSLRPEVTAGAELLTDWQRFGAELNTTSFRTVNARYEEAGFLYAEKRARLEPYWTTIADNWERTMSAGDELRRLYSWQSSNGSRWAHLDLWRATDRSWWVQHLVANGGGAGSLATMLAATARSFADPWLIGCEAWFRPANPFANRLLGGGADALGRDGGQSTQSYLRVPLFDHGPEPGRRVQEVHHASADLLRLATENRHPAYPTITALPDDPQLAAVNSRYQAVGLRRYRRIFTATDRAGRLRGAALAYRAPLGLNYSFLENRCDVLLSDEDPEEASGTARALVAAAADTYRDFTPGFIPVTLSSDTPTAQSVRAALGGELLQTYAQAVWLRAGLPRLAQYFHRAGQRTHRPPR